PRARGGEPLRRGQLRVPHRRRRRADADPGGAGAAAGRPPPGGRRVSAAFVPFPRTALEQSIGARFEAQARRGPDRLAVKHGATAWTYAQLDAAANRVARAILAARGPGAEPVGLVLEQGAWLVAAILGALKAGKIYVPLDPA